MKNMVKPKPSTFGMNQKTLSAYITGLLLSLIFTALSFSSVIYPTFSTRNTILFLLLLATSQFIAQVIFFLRMNAQKEGQWNLMPFLFTLVIMSAIVGGSLWIMYNLNYNMMH